MSQTMNRGKASALNAFMSDNLSGMASMLETLVKVESPSSEPSSQRSVQDILMDSLRGLNFHVEILPGEKSGGQLLAEYRGSATYRGKQLLLGHSDTVWPIGTIESMPFVIRNGKAFGPGVFDMKGGLVQMIFALRALKSLEFEPALTPVVFINSDEEIGSVESESEIRRLAADMERVYVAEPALGHMGKLKTARKGVGQFTVTINGRAAHAGLDPENGASAILELSHVIQALTDLTDIERGVTVNVGIVRGGLRVNVIAPWSEALVDVRVPSMAEAKEIERKILGLETKTPGTSIEIEGGVNRQPLERTPANQRLWTAAVEMGALLGVDLEEGMAGGGSDGNTTSQYAATLDGLGAVGDGAHAAHEFLFLEKMVERASLLALLLLVQP